MQVIAHDRFIGAKAIREAAETEVDSLAEHSEIVATGNWFYDGVAAKPICIRSKPARLASSRYDDDDQLDESRPIPATKNGLVYKCDPGGGEGLTLEDAKAWADAQPCSPIFWD